MEKPHRSLAFYPNTNTKTAPPLFKILRKPGLYTEKEKLQTFYIKYSYFPSEINNFFAKDLARFPLKQISSKLLLFLLILNNA